MSSRLTMMLAGFFLVAALVAGYWGLVLSRPSVPVEQPAPVMAPVAAPAAPTPAKAEEPVRSQIVVLRRDVAANTPLTPDDLLLERLQVVPAGAFQRIEQVVGRSSMRPLAAGSWLAEDSFQAGGPLARMIRPHERAVAVAVDDVIGAAGQLLRCRILVLCRNPVGNRQQHSERAALCHFAADRDVPVALADDTVKRGEPEAGSPSRGFRREIRLENLL